MEESITIVVCSRDDADKRKDFIEHLKTTCGCNAHVFFMVNQEGVSLTKVYEDMLKSENNTNDITIFIHDDVEFLRNGWGAEIIRQFKDHTDYGIIGVAGSAQFDEMAAWWNYPKRFGQVAHKSNGKAWLTQFSPLLNHDLEEVCVIDGLFMAVHKKRISKNFNPEINGFNFYDIDFCLSNFLDGKTKIGVTTNIRMCHMSTGETSDEWYKNREIINNKYKKYYPIEVKK